MASNPSSNRQPWHFWDNGEFHGKEIGKFNGYWDCKLYRGYIDVILGLYRDNGQEHGNYYPIKSAALALL